MPSRSSGKQKQKQKQKQNSFSEKTIKKQKPLDFVSPYLRLPPTRKKELVKLLRTNIYVGNHKYHFKTYENTFVGNQATNYLVQSNLVPKRLNAIQKKKIKKTIQTQNFFIFFIFFFV